MVFTARRSAEIDDVLLGFWLQQLNRQRRGKILHPPVAGVVSRNRRLQRRLESAAVAGPICSPPVSAASAAPSPDFAVRCKSGSSSFARGRVRAQARGRASWPLFAATRLAKQSLAARHRNATDHSRLCASRHSGNQLPLSRLASSLRYSPSRPQPREAACPSIQA